MRILLNLVFLGLIAALVMTAQIGAAHAADASAVTRVKNDERNCAHCDLSGADLSFQCVKTGDLTGANFDHVIAHYMCMSKANFTNVTFRGADLTGANLADSNLTNADLTGAVLDITSIKGTDLSTAKGLTQAQIDLSCGDERTKLPAGLKMHSCAPPSAL